MQAPPPPKSLRSGSDLVAAYDTMVKSANLERDPAQLELVKRLDGLAVRLNKRRLASKSSALGWLFGKNGSATAEIKGIYIWGSVGRGKSMLMDLFYNHLEVDGKRVHFNDFMVDVHERIHAHRAAYQKGETTEKDPLIPVAEAISQQAQVLCFDEFTVTDIADAMILGRLFEELFKHRVVIVATSNVAPENLYKDGLNRGLFLPFIDILRANTEVFELDARTDFRLEKLRHAPVYLSPLSQKSLMAMESAWQRLTGGQAAEPLFLEVKGRQFEVPAAVGGVARFHFSDLCEQPVGAADFLALARTFHTVFIDEVRIIQPSERNVAKRFILLIDTLYDNKIKLVVTAQASPNGIYLGSTGTEAFEFDRTASRLIEMQSLDYLSGAGEEG